MTATGVADTPSEFSIRDSTSKLDKVVINHLSPVFDDGDKGNIFPLKQPILSHSSNTVLSAPVKTGLRLFTTDNNHHSVDSLAMASRSLWGGRERVSIQRNNAPGPPKI